jgi:type VI secretion system protein ImpB
MDNSLASRYCWYPGRLFGGSFAASEERHNYVLKRGTMARESTQTKLSRVRPPRVQISYEVNAGDAIEIKEIPFVMGVLGDFTGQPTEPLEELKKRKFVEVTPDNFDDVLAKMKPHLNFAVENKLSEDGGKLKVDLNFRSLEDFEPENVARQVPALREMLDMRRKLADLRGSLQTNDALETELQDIVKNTEKMKQLEAELGGGKE